MSFKSYCDVISGEFFAEFLGTFILMSITNGVLASFELNKKVSPEDSHAMGVVSGTAAMIGIMTSLPISGGHVNPSVTVAFAVVGRFPWKKVPHYLVGQHLGSFASCFFIYITYLDGLNAFDGGIRSAYGTNTSTGQLFATYPNIHVTIFTSFFDQVFSTALLLLGVSAIIDEKGINLPVYLQPFITSLLITALGLGYGFNCGAILNPARDIAPRLFTALCGWGHEPFKPLGGHYWWVAGFAGPHVGAVLGCAIYSLLIKSYQKPIEKEKEKECHSFVMVSNEKESPTL